MFVWKKDFELGIKSIDEQHKHLMDIGNRIYEMLSSGVYHSDEFENQIEAVLEELKDYTKYHFRTEEDLFLKYSYPDMAEHIKEHRGLIDYIDAFDVSEIIDSQEALEELLKKVINWVFHHIITTDFMYKDFLIKKGMS